MSKEPRWITDSAEVPTASSESLRRSLLTSDGRGEAVKGPALDELLRRERAPLEAWQSSFGTSQLTHAVARLEAAEDKAARRLRMLKDIVRHMDEVTKIQTDGRHTRAQGDFWDEVRWLADAST